MHWTYPLAHCTNLRDLSSWLNIASRTQPFKYGFSTIACQKYMDYISQMPLELLMLFGSGPQLSSMHKHYRRSFRRSLVSIMAFMSGTDYPHYVNVLFTTRNTRKYTIATHNLPEYCKAEYYKHPYTERLLQGLVQPKLWIAAAAFHSEEWEMSLMHATPH